MKTYPIWSGENLQMGPWEPSPAPLSISFTPNYELITPDSFLFMMVAAEEVVGP